MSPSENQPGESNAYQIYIPIGVFLVVCPFMVGTRLWSRVIKGGHIGSDDYTILGSLTFSLASSAVMLAACYYGYGQHAVNLSPTNKVEALKWFWVCQITYKACMNLTKISILLLYIRIFGTVRWFRLSCIFMATAVALYGVASIFATIFSCSPISFAWDKRNRDGKTTNVDNLQFWYANAGFSIATDIIILLIPMPLVYTLQIPRVQKAALMFVFTLGIFVVVTSCLRVTTIDVQATTPDQTFDIVSTMWTIIEMNVAIVCACLPQIRPLIVKIFPKLMPASYSRDRSGGKTPYDSGFSKGHRPDRSKMDDNRWARIDGKDGIHMTNIRKGDKGDTGSEEYILQDDKSMHIQKTVGYSIEFSKDSHEHV